MNTPKDFSRRLILRALGLGLIMGGSAHILCHAQQPASPTPLPANTSAAVAATPQSSTISTENTPHLYTSSDQGLYTSNDQGVYYRNTIIPGADPKTFSSLREVTYWWKANAYGKDATHVYINEKPVPGADAATFILLDDHSQYAKDAAQVYYGEGALSGVDPKTFTILGEAANDYGKDATHVYYRNKPIPGADPATFILLPEEEIREVVKKLQEDKKLIYKNGWVAITNWIKYQTLNPKVKQGIVEELKKAPTGFIDSIGVGPDKLSISYPWAMDTLSHLNSNLNLNLNLLCRKDVLTGRRLL